VFPFHFQYVCNLTQKVLINREYTQCDKTFNQKSLNKQFIFVLWVKCELSSSTRTHHHCGQVCLPPLRDNEDKQRLNQHYAPEHHPHGNMFYLIFCHLHDLLEYFCIFTFCSNSIKNYCTDESIFFFVNFTS
jgi:hypothetical protein